MRHLQITRVVLKRCRVGQSDQKYLKYCKIFVVLQLHGQDFDSDSSFHIKTTSKLTHHKGPNS